MSGSASPSLGKTCCLRDCVQAPSSNTIADDCRRVEIQAFESKKKKDKYLVNWGSDGAAMFHNSCWENLVKATKLDSMASDLSDVERSLILEAKKTAEFHDPEQAVAQEAARIAAIFKRCGHCIAFTGAGISTAAGIGDFRGKDGKWTRRDREKNYGVKAAAKPNKGVAMGQLRPTYTHEALCKLVDMGVLKFIISQNVDGLHRLSGVPKEKMAELHGNAFTERCEDCGTVYELKQHYSRGKGASQSTQKKCTRCRIPHRTGRKCPKEGCSGYLANTIINFGDYLESDVLGMAEEQAKRADAVLVLGSSLRVSPANDLVTMGKKPHRLIICNRQTTPYDSDCLTEGAGGPLGSRVFCDCDKLMRKIMELMLPSPSLQEWEGDREARMADYAMNRLTFDGDVKR